MFGSATSGLGDVVQNEGLFILSENEKLKQTFHDVKMNGSQSTFIEEQANTRFLDYFKTSQETGDDQKRYQQQYQQIPNLRLLKELSLIASRHHV